MLQAALLASVQRSLALAIRQDPLTAKRLGRLEGRTILIRMREPSHDLFIQPSPSGIRLTQQYTGMPDCTLSAPATLLARLVLSSNRQQLLLSPELELTGNTQILVELQNILGDLQLDGEAALARWLGPVAAHTLGNFARQSNSWRATARTTVQQSISDYLTQEGRQLVGCSEADAVAAQIHELRLQLDRIDARVEHLAHTAKGTNEE